MVEAITYQNMLGDIRNNQINKDLIGILITRPDLEGGKSIIDSLNYYHHLSRGNMNFYLPGYGAYWYGAYPDGRVITKINGTEWSFSDMMFAGFIAEIELHSNWEYSGESELLMMEYRDGILSFDKIMQFHLDAMLRDKVISSVHSFFQQLFRVCKKKKTLKEISNVFGKDKLVQVTKEAIFDNLPSGLVNVFTQEKYFCVRNCNKR